VPYARTVCCEVGCPRTATYRGRCPAHQPPKSPSNRGRGSRQRRNRRRVLVRSTICHICGRPGADTVDHTVPAVDGSQWVETNLKPAHKSCNSRRGARLGR
jgi:5-methylcytosine-specific restriction endonuclease McrA